MLPAQPNQSLIDGLACLQALATSEAPVGSRELGRRLGLEATRVNRLLKTLAHLGLARQVHDRRYQPGPAMHVLSIQSLRASGLIRRAVPVLERLHDTGMVVALGVLWHDQVSYLYHGQPGDAASQAIGRVGLFPAQHSAIGLVLLAQLPAAQAIRQAGAADNATLLRRHLQEVRQRGYAVVVHREQPVDAALAVALEDDSGAAIALAGEIHRRDYPRLARRLQEAARDIVG